jgi:hypothetical protein
MARPPVISKPASAIDSLSGCSARCVVKRCAAVRSAEVCWLLREY